VFIRVFIIQSTGEKGMQIPFKRTHLSTIIGSIMLGSAALLSGCAGDGKDGSVGLDGQTYSSIIDFQAISPAVTDSEKNSIRSSDTVTIAGEKQTIAYNTLLKTGDTDNGEVFGAIKDSTDTVIMDSNGTSPSLCNGTQLPSRNDNPKGSGLDHVSILQKNNKLYMVSQFECQVGAMYMNELTQDSTTGALSVTPNTLQYVSQASGFGGWVHCAGMTTPWQSHLGSEEYDSNARSIETNGAASDTYFNALSDYWGGDMSKASPYYYGWTPEVAVDASGAPVYTKHYSMGRFAHEMGYVMPDEKTVYLSDDGTNVTLFMYKADTAQDLSSGTLYAAKWNQVSGTGIGEAVLTWVDLGNASDADVEAVLNPDGDVTTNDGVTFSDIFNTEAPQADGSCATAGFVAVNTAAGNECLQRTTNDLNGDATYDAKDDAIANRLESRRMAAYLGATSEFRKMEGITFNARDNKLYVAMSQVTKGMQAGTSNDKGGPDHIQVESNSCGGVYELTTAFNDSIGSDYVAYNMKGLVAGKAVNYDGTALAGNSCDIDGISNPDNVTFLEDSNVLLIGEDTDGHINDALWTYDIVNKTLTRIAHTPYGSEATSPYWYKDINGFGYLTLTTQHPFGETGVDPQYLNSSVPTDEASLTTQTGYVGPFNFSRVK
jgi:uncharacterized protein